MNSLDICKIYCLRMTFTKAAKDSLKTVAGSFASVYKRVKKEALSP